jgi:hypothetical protein
MLITDTQYKNTTLESRINYVSLLVGDIGFEPITSTTSMWRSSQMS